MAPSAPLDPLLHYDISSGYLINHVTYFISFTNNGKKLFKLTKEDMSEGGVRPKTGVIYYDIEAANWSCGCSLSF